MDALVIGGGPAGLAAAEVLAGAGRRVLLAEAKPSVGRKLLMAGKSGLNLTKQEEGFGAAYGTDWLAPMLEAFGPAEVRAWAEGLGQESFVGSTGRVFPRAMKASPLLRAWLGRLNTVELRTRWRWRGWEGNAALFDTPGGAERIEARVTVLALGGASWARLGSDGAWAEVLAGEGVELAPFRPANMGFEVVWSAHMAPHFGSPVKGVRLSAGAAESRGEFVVSARGLEGGGIYEVSAAMREGAPLVLDLLPETSVEDATARLAKGGKESVGNRLRKRLGLSPVARALVMEFGRPLPEGAALAALIKALPVAHGGPRPLDEAISVAGGVTRAAVDDGLMLKARPGVFVAGEMLDWEAPTGGYLLTGCFATGRWAGQHALRYLNQDVG
ncbi:TIGR03862 family flavoprotein [Oceanicola sp. 502str15]|uniref:TIGR03862 family flavoprotein n=1 Tax=Oceanicola sp. 502str15 TaxID=2696061 RepID=UPI0020942DF9|nr:TIGR03862 family flavoprotein [Oceanicola sp. 502str15]MCO6384438.1 TIGR03862 family flavoprotein [Oceanicola sp. 502str15]